MIAFTTMHCGETLFLGLDMGKVFLSHSSKDKNFVERVVSALKPGTYELDSETFPFGETNCDAIIESLRRCDVFCLFLSKNSLESSYVKFEEEQARELRAQGQIKKFIIFCLDTESFEKCSNFIKGFNIVCKDFESAAVARRIEEKLSFLESQKEHPFIGRSAEIKEMERQASDLERPNIKALFISGSYGSGRRALAKQFLRNQYPSCCTVISSVELDQFDGKEEFYRKILANNFTELSELTEKVKKFKELSEDKKIRDVANLLNNYLFNKETLFIIDKGGLLQENGDFSKDMSAIIPLLNSKPHPPVIFIAQRHISKKFERPEKDIIYVSLKEFTFDDTELTLSRLLKNESLQIDTYKFEQLIELTKQHPLNIYELVEHIKSYGVDAILADPSLYFEWNKRQQKPFLDSYISKASDSEVKRLVALSSVPGLNFDTIKKSINIPIEEISNSLRKLIESHFIYLDDDIYKISFVWQDIIERDERIKIRGEDFSRMMRVISKKLEMEIEEGTAPVKLLDSSILARLENGEKIPPFLGAFLLPSHFVLMSKRSYDSRKWKESMRYAEKALKGESGRLSEGGIIGACRYLCLAAARVNDSESFKTGIEKLRTMKSASKVDKHIDFLEGFFARRRGYIPKAEEHFREAYEKGSGDFSVARELAAVCLERNKFDEAERFAREAYSHTPANPYIIDILIACLMRKGSSDELESLFEELRKYGDADNKSFYLTRRAEYECECGRTAEADRLISRALKKTPTIFEVQRVKAQVLLKQRKLPEAKNILDRLRHLSNRNYQHKRAYVVTYVDYLKENKNWKEAKAEYRKHEKTFSRDEIEQMIKAIDSEQAYS